jgi:soluble lytic murein transglycosylase-like protein
VRHRPRIPLALRALVAASCAWPLVAFADLWTYVDADGQSHVADHRVDARYTLFFKGRTTLDVADDVAAARAQAQAALAGTPLYARATDPALVAKYAPLIAASAAKNHVDAALVTAVVAAESGFDPHALSGKGAIGLMQVMPDTAARYGVAPDRRRSLADKLRDPSLNVSVGTRYLHDLLARFGGDPVLALAAYNAGEGAVAQHANRVPPFRETQGYVERVRALYALYRPVRLEKGPVRIVKPRYADVASE